MTTSENAEPTRANLAALTGTRGLAAWFVVLYHIRPGLSAAAPPDLMAVLGKGYLAVDFFFMLSGFVLWLNYGSRLREGGLPAAPALLGRRIARIWPLHAVVLLGAVALALVKEAAGKRDAVHYPWDELPLHVLLVQNWGWTGRLSWNDPAWSISCEWAAYLLFPLLALTADWRRLPSAALVLLLGLLAGGLHMIMAGAGAATLGVDIPRFGLPRALVEFVMGTLVCALWQTWRGRPGGAATAGFAIAAGLFALTATGAIPETLGVPLLFASLLLALALTATHARNPLASRPLVYLGEISYATYLAHFLLYRAFKLLFVTDAFAVPLPLVAAFLLATLIASVCLYHLVELPAQTAINRWLRGPSQERVAAPAL